MTDDWVRMTRHYAARDLAFIIGGTSLLLCLSYCFPSVKDYAFGSDMSGPEYLLLAGGAYVLGYLAQEVLSILFCGWVTTSTEIKPSKCLKWAHKRYTHVELDWTKLPDYDEDDATIYINTTKSERNQADYERMTAHLVMCMTIGSCWILGGCILMGRILFVRNWHVLLFGFAMLCLGCCLVFLGRLKAVQVKKFRHDLIKGLNPVRRSLKKSQGTEA